ncbi:MAG TPA: creatininase family protein [Candidatus Saccharimonadales bacterium]|nr:creatininase family protein [Candidatus Saccharimonadales bacterium]
MRNTSEKYFLENMNAVEVNKIHSSESIVFILLGSCENHGNHLPFGSDFLFPVNLVRLVLDNIIESKRQKKYNFIVLPVIPYGVSIHHIDYEMTISLRSSTMINMIEDVLSCLATNEIRRVIILNGHDGNIAPAETAARNIKNKHPEMVIACLESWWTLVGQKNKNAFDVWSGLGHGGEAETSAMMAVRPDLVDLTLAPNQTIPNLPREDIRIYWKFNELTKTGSTGAPRSATIQKGKEIIKILTNMILDFVDKMESTNWKYGTSISNTK